MLLQLCDLPHPHRLFLHVGYEDELAWAAAWLYKATSNASYLTDARSFYRKVGMQWVGRYLRVLPDRASMGIYSHEQPS